MVVSGDTDQCDIVSSGLQDAIDRLKRIDGVKVVNFSDQDIVRSKICKEIILAYKN